MGFSFDPVSPFLSDTALFLHTLPSRTQQQDLRAVTPVWYNTTMAIFNDDEAHKAWNCERFCLEAR